MFPASSGIVQKWIRFELMNELASQAFPRGWARETSSIHRGATLHISGHKESAAKILDGWMECYTHIVFKQWT